MYLKKKFKIFFLLLSFALYFQILEALENKILFKIDNEIITTLDIYQEIKFLRVFNPEVNSLDKKELFEISKNSILKNKIKKIELSNFVEELKVFLEKYKLNSDVTIKDISGEYVVGIISNEKFEEIKKEENKTTQTIIYRSSPFFQDPRSKKLGSRVLSNLEKLYLTIKKLSLKIEDGNDYFNNAHEAGIPIKNLKKLQNNLFGLEANFEELSAIDFKKGCYIGQENTARMKLKNKLRKKLLPIVSKENLKIGSEITLDGNQIGKLLIANPYPFGLVNISDKKMSELKNKEILVGKQRAKII